MKERSVWADNLKSFIILIVVALHAALSYTTYGTFNRVAYIFSVPHPMIDSVKWIGMDWFVYFNDIFLMALMFFVSGLFVTASLNRKGSREFIRDRFNRLFIPFIFGVVILMELAHYPSYVLAHNDHDILNYLGDFFTKEYWPVGPPWFLWVLFLFNVIIARTYHRVKRLIDKMSETLLRYRNSVLSVFIFWFSITWILYVPLRWIFGPSLWTGFGPFDFQLCRFILYLGYFIAGVAFGNIPEKDGLFSGSFTFMKRWQLWSVLCIISFAVLILIGEPLQQLVDSGKLSNPLSQIIYCSVYVASCTFSCLAFLSVFKTLVNSTTMFWESLRTNAFFIYLSHYIFVIWGQYLLLSLPVQAIVKFLIVTITSLAISWSLSFILRKNRIIRRYI